MRQVTRFLFTTTVCGAVLVSCAGSDAGDQAVEVVVTDSAGITIIDNGVLPEPDSVEVLRPTLEIGVREGDDTYQLFRVIDAKRLDDGAIAVTNGGSRELRIYEADGTHRVTAGGHGEGPSEFRFPTGIVLRAGDTIQVEDFMDRVFFGHDGAFLGRETGDRQILAELAQSMGGFSEGGRWMADGTFFAPVYERSQGSPRPGPLRRPRMTFVRLSPDLERVETLGEFGGIQQQFIDVGDPFGVAPNVPPFARNALAALGAADGTVVVGDNANPQIERFHPDGTRSIVRWASEAVPGTDEEVEAWKQTQRNASWAQDRLPALERAWAAMDVPETKPYFGRVMVGSDGTLWVDVESPVDETTVHVFGADGHFQCTVRFARGVFTVYDSGPGWVLGVLRDADDVEFVQLYELSRQSAQFSALANETQAR